MSWTEPSNAREELRRFIQRKVFHVKNLGYGLSNQDYEEIMNAIDDYARENFNAR